MNINALSDQPKRTGEGYFNDLPPAMRTHAEQWLARFRDRWQWNLPNWRLAILIGRARYLALNPPNSAWGRRMLAARGGHALQRLKRERREKPKLGSIDVFTDASGSQIGPPAKLLRKQSNRSDAPRRFELPKDSASPLINTALPPPAPEARAIHRLLDPPGCRCYYCAWPNYEQVQRWT